MPHDKTVSKISFDSIVNRLIKFDCELVLEYLESLCDTLHSSNFLPP